jgi:Protein of unknown function (DUF2933)
METEPQSLRQNWRKMLIRTPLGWALALAIAAIGAYFLVTHTGHVLMVLPFLLLMACPLMHVFMHGGHGHDHAKK